MRDRVSVCPTCFSSCELLRREVRRSLVRRRRRSAGCRPRAAASASTSLEAMLAEFGFGDAGAAGALKRLGEGRPAPSKRRRPAAWSCRPTRRRTPPIARRGGAGRRRRRGRGRGRHRTSPRTRGDATTEGDEHIAAVLVLELGWSPAASAAWNAGGVGGGGGRRCSAPMLVTTSSSAASEKGDSWSALSRPGAGEEPSTTVAP